MKAIQLKNPWEINCINMEKPIPKQGEALIRIKAAGICGSDIGAFRGTNRLVSYPRIIGHELAGEVVTISPDNKKGIKPGDRVVIDPYIYCSHCYPCSIGRTNCCTNLKVPGVHINGGMAEYFTHPEDLLIRIPEELSFAEAAMAEPMTISLHGIHRGNLKKGEYCVIIGAGPIGLIAAMIARAYEAHPILIDVVQERLDFSRRQGIKYIINPDSTNPEKLIYEITNGTMAQLVMECSGSNKAIKASLNYVSHAGRITFTGWPKQETNLPTDIITKKEIDIRGARTSAGEFEEALELMKSKKVDLTETLTKTVSIDEATKTIIDIEKNPSRYMKVVVTV